MMLPTIHDNGTSRANLATNYMSAAHAVDMALDALRKTAPNGRDYYPQGPAAMEAAIQEHMERDRLLRHVLSDLETLADYCDAD